MFTGLVEDVGTLAGRRPEGRAAKIEIKTGLPLAEVVIGESIAINGACLTVEEIRTDSATLGFHALNETLRRTSLHDVPVGGKVNMERAMCLGDRLGGHLVMGHVDTTARIVSIGRSDDDYQVCVELPPAIQALVIPKGSIAIDGISLTIAKLAADTFTVCIIPHTWEMTNLPNAKAGTVVNLEADMVGKYILRQRDNVSPSTVTMTDLERAGFGY